MEVGDCAAISAREQRNCSFKSLSFFLQLVFCIYFSLIWYVKLLMNFFIPKLDSTQVSGIIGMIHIIRSIYFLWYFFFVCLKNDRV